MLARRTIGCVLRVPSRAHHVRVLGGGRVQALASDRDGLLCGERDLQAWKWTPGVGGIVIAMQQECDSRRQRSRTSLVQGTAPITNTPYCCP
jgi:hypothetical protein